MVEYTKEDLKRLEPNKKYLPLLMDAEENGDDELAAELRKKIIVPAEALLAARDISGPEWILGHGLNCSEAERKYGKNWLYDETL